MKKVAIALGFITCVSLHMPVHAADSTPAPRISIFSTSVDWQGITDLSYSEYFGHFKYGATNKLVGRGLILYYLDGFPCYGLGNGVRVWLGQAGRHDGELRIACIYPPREIKFAYRNAARDADQAATTGMLTCQVDASGRDLTIDLSKCVRGADWKEYK